MSSVQEKLRQVFLLDQQVRSLSSRLDQFKDQHHRHQIKFEQLNQQRGELDRQLKITQVAGSTAEKRVNEVEQRIAQLRNQMNSVKSNKEYSAMLIEVNTAKEDLGKFEEAALALMTRVDILRQELTDIDQRLAEQEKRVASAKAEVDACAAEIDQELGSLTGRRDEAESGLPAEALAMFQRVANIHDGETMAEVVETNRRLMEYSCGGCFLSMPVERVNAVISNRDNVVCCPSCGRILYVDQEMRESVSGK